MFDWFTDTILQPVFDGASAVGDFLFGSEAEFADDEYTSGLFDDIGSFLFSGDESKGASSNKASVVAAKASLKNRRDILQMKKLTADRAVREGVKNRMQGLPTLPVKRATDTRQQYRDALNTAYAQALKNGRAQTVASHYTKQVKKHSNTNPYASAMMISDPYSDVG